jgi:hypothetical protein
MRPHRQIRTCIQGTWISARPHSFESTTARRIHCHVLHGSVSINSSLIQLLCFWALSIVLVLFKTQRPYLLTCPEMWTSSIDWGQLSRFHMKTETQPSLRNVVCFKLKTERWIVSRNTITVLIQHRHKHLDLSSLIVLVMTFADGQ